METDMSQKVFEIDYSLLKLSKSSDFAQQQMKVSIKQETAKGNSIIVHNVDGEDRNFKDYDSFEKWYDAAWLQPVTVSLSDEFNIYVLSGVW